MRKEDDDLGIEYLDAICKTWNAEIKVIRKYGEPHAVIK